MTTATDTKALADEIKDRGICSKAFDRTHPYAEGYAHQKTKECAVDWKPVAQ